jgi:meiotically up-regulated gene 157 (Mug157) protein
MAMAMRGLTSDNIDGKARIIEQLRLASAGTPLMHESFEATNPKKFTRPWFCWADSIFAELVMSMSDQCPGEKKYMIRHWKDPMLPEGGKFAGDQRIEKK